MLGDSVIVNTAETAGDLRGVPDADGDRLTVTEVVGAGGFDGVSEGVAVVEDGPPSPSRSSAITTSALIWTHAATRSSIGSSSRRPPPRK